MWVDSLFQAIGQALGLAKQSTDPEVIRLAQIRSLKAQLKVQYAKLDALLATQDTPETKEANAIALGLIVNTIVGLRNEKSSLEK